MDYFFAALAGYALGIATVAVVALVKAAKAAREAEAEEDDYFIGCENLDGGDDLG